LKSRYKKVVASECEHCRAHLVLPEEWRLVGGAEALTGILMCGLSTGLFFAVFAKVFRIGAGGCRCQCGGAFKLIGGSGQNSAPARFLRAPPLSAEMFVLVLRTRERPPARNSRRTPAASAAETCSFHDDPIAKTGDYVACGHTRGSNASCCIHWLLRQCPVPYESAPFEIELEHPKRIVAAELNITSETLSRTLTGLRGKQLIRTSGKTIVVLNPLRLEGFMRNRLGEALEHAPRQMNHAASASAPSNSWRGPKNSK
jgi:hypothetical protein